MDPYNNNILIIDDHIDEIETEIVLPLQRMNFSVKTIPDPEDGLKIASHRYSIIFIDFRFDLYRDITDGAKLCREIRDKCPLSTLILITGFDRAHWEEFAHAPWDGCFEKNKPGEKPRNLDARVADCVNEAVQRRYHEIPLLASIPIDEKVLHKKVKILDDLEEYYTIEPKARYYDDGGIAKGLNYNNREALANKFVVVGLETRELKKDAMIFRHLIMNEPTKWCLAKQYFPPLRKLVDYFGL